MLKVYLSKYNTLNKGKKRYNNLLIKAYTSILNNFKTNSNKSNNY